MPCRDDVVRSSTRAFTTGQAAITFGLALLVVNAWFPAGPVVTAMSLVALGATNATLARFRGQAALIPVITVHLATYGGLYALFVGATMHSAVYSESGLGTLAAIDLAVSTLPMALVLSRTLSNLPRAADPEH